MDHHKLPEANEFSVFIILPESSHRKSLSQKPSADKLAYSPYQLKRVALIAGSTGSRKTLPSLSINPSTLDDLLPSKTREIRETPETLKTIHSSCVVPSPAVYKYTPAF